MQYKKVMNELTPVVIIVRRDIIQPLGAVKLKTRKCCGGLTARTLLQSYPTDFN